MSDSSPSLHQISDSARASANQVGARIISVQPAIGKSGSRIMPATADFLDLIEHLRPKVLYLTEFTFNAESDVIEAVEEALEDQTFDEDGQYELEDHSRVKAAVKQWRNRNGQLYRLIIGFMSEGLYHFIFEQDPWQEDFDDAIQALAAGIAEDWDKARTTRLATDRKAFADRARTLVADSRFHAPKVSRDKRRYLASVLFPDADDDAIWKIVEEAENMHWLASAESR